MTLRQIGDPTLSGIEWKVVSLALRDADRCGCASRTTPGAIRRAMSRIWRAVTGIEERKMSLGDPRLEALRRFVCKSRRWRRAADDLSPELAAQGFNASQIQALGLLAAL